VSALTIAERMMNSGFVVTSTSLEASSGLTIVFIKLPEKGSRIIPEKITDITNITIIKMATQPIFVQKCLWVSAIVLVIVELIFIPSTIMMGKINRYIVTTYNIAKKAPTISTKIPRTIAMDPANARSTIIIRYGIKYFRDLTIEVNIVFSLSIGLKIT
jgi:hypothetical protein